MNLIQKKKIIIMFIKKAESNREKNINLKGEILLIIGKVFIKTEKEIDLRNLEKEKGQEVTAKKEKNIKIMKIIKIILYNKKVFILLKEDMEDQ